MGSGGEAPPPCTPSSCLHRCVQGYIWEAGGALLGMSQRLSGSDVCSGVLVQWWGGEERRGNPFQEHVGSSPASGLFKGCCKLFPAIFSIFCSPFTGAELPGRHV